ncbi:hypothetical protein CGLO_03784 [Colletotrichum gloeosporioides Cg-14]|uniref:Uncharacterized protein n=1 Tax=Colletotrichum gloeosporioides (strain Cg-14) TaxID=1237896 RepID=T0KU70_COLGC|nr:hypothetical protein CGLO_03784 [Colletotrichum gloeosporioides Cg-14]
MKLKDKKRKHGESNEDKWKDIFNILFPDAIETPCPYYRSRAIEKPQDGSANPNDIKQGIIDNLFGGDQVLDIETTARSRMEKMTGSLPEEDWREMKRIFRDFAFAGMASQISVCNSSTFSASQQVPDTKLVSGQGSREVREHEDAFLLVPKHGERRVEVDDNGEPDIAELLHLEFVIDTCINRTYRHTQAVKTTKPAQPTESTESTQSITSSKPEWDKPRKGRGSVNYSRSCGRFN